MDIILASASPRRAELLQTLGLPFTVQTAQVDENAVCDTPAALVETLANRKAEAVLPAAPEGSLILGADTVVVQDGEILGKPHSEEEAIRMLTRLSGRSHEVYTGLALLESGGQGRRVLCHERALVRFRPLAPWEIARYVGSGEPMDKAGAYGIQALGATLVESVTGDYFAVVGLPLCRLALCLRSFGVEVLPE